MRNKRQQGKMTVLSIIMALLLVYGSFAAFKLISSGLTKKQIKKEVYDTLGNMRGGGDFTVNKAIDAIYGILEKQGVDVETAGVDVKLSSGQLSYEVVYEMETDLLLFKKKDQVEFREAMDAYGG